MKAKLQPAAWLLLLYALHIKTLWIEVCPYACSRNWNLVILSETQIKTTFTILFSDKYQARI